MKFHFKPRARRSSYEINMTEGPLLGKLVQFSIPLALSGVLQLLFNAADIVVVAVGQGIETMAFEHAGIPIHRGTIEALSDSTLAKTDMDGVFAGGDCVTGPASAIKAIAAGKVAAANIDEYLGFHHEISVDVSIPAPALQNKAPHGRVNTTEREAGERKNDFHCIECGLTDQGAEEESSRCLRCDRFGYGSFKGGRKQAW